MEVFVLNSSFIVEVSARHVHLTEQAVEILFGKGHELSVKKDLSQPGQFACNERVDIVGPKNVIKNVSVLGPVRGYVQVEVSATDARVLGVEGVVRESGNLENTPGCELVGPCGRRRLRIDRGLIVAKRHIHASVEDASRLGLQNGQEVWVKVLSNRRCLIFGEVVVRVSDSYRLAMHIDTDESNASGCSMGTMGEVVDVE